MIAKKEMKIEFGGEVRTFYFGLGFLGLFIDKTSSNINTLEKDVQENPFKVLPLLMYYSLLYGCLRNDTTPNFTPFSVADWMDEEGGMQSKPVLDFMAGLSASMNAGLPVEKAVKKKVVMPKI